MIIDKGYFMRQGLVCFLLDSIFLSLAVKELTDQKIIFGKYRHLHLNMSKSNFLLLGGWDNIYIAANLSHVKRLQHYSPRTKMFCVKLEIY